MKLILIFILFTATAVAAETIHLKSGAVFEADSVKVEGESLIIQIRGGEVAVKWDELVEADARKFFPKIFEPIDRAAREKVEKARREAEAREAARKESERVAAEQRARQEEATRRAAEEAEKKARREKELGVNTLVGRVVQVVDGGFFFYSLTSDEARAGMNNMQLAESFRPTNPHLPVQEQLRRYHQEDVPRLRKLDAATTGVNNGNFEAVLPFLDQLDATPRFIVGYPKQKVKDFVENQALVIRVRRDGNFEYRNTKGFLKTVEKWVVWNPDAER